MQLCLIILMAVCLAQTAFSKNYKKLKTTTYATVNPKNRSEIITLIHIKKENLTSCLDALTYGLADEEIKINNNGTEILVHCDHTTEGGG